MKWNRVRVVRMPRYVALAVSASLLAGCGGGGGGGGTVRVDPPPATLQPPVVLAPRAEYSKHLVATNAAPARVAGLTGAGVRIGVVDSGINRSHPALNPRVVANLNYVSSSNNNLAVDDVQGHGTAVAQIMAGTAFGEWPGGIAPGATMVSARIIQDKSPDDDGSGQGNEITGAIGLKPIHQDLINRGVKIMNNSWGGLYWTNPSATAPIADEYRPFIMGNGGLVVFATGNSGFADPSSMAALPSQPGPNGTLPAADLERGWIAVTAVNPDSPGQLDTGSDGTVYPNACGVAMRYCLAAPGTVIVTGTNNSPTNPDYWRWKGTSFAAPIVSGAAALVWEAFPYFNNDLLRQTLLGTALDIGAPGVDSIFGYGLLDIGKAIKGPGRFDWGDVSVSFSGNSSWSNAIAGAGGLIKNGSGRLDLTGANTYAGATQVLGGTLAATQSLPGNATVGTGAVLDLSAGVRGHLENQGTVITRTTQAHAVAGNYHQTSTARFAFQVGAPLAVTGQALIDGGDAQVIGVASGYTRSARETILTAAGGVTGRFSTLSAGSGVFLEATLGYEPDSIWLKIDRLDVTATASALGFSATSLSGAERVEGAFSAIDNGVVPGTDGVAGGAGFLSAAGLIQSSATAVAAEQTLSSLSGDMHGADTAYAMMAIEGSRHALEARLDARGAQAPEGGWWDRLGGQRASQAQLSIDANGWVLGQDYRVADGLTVGGALAETVGQGFRFDRGDRERNRQVESQVYGQWQLGEGYVLARLSQGQMTRQMHRDIVLGGAAFGVASDYDNRYTTLGVQVGRRLGEGNGGVTPYLGMQSVQMQRSGFSEQGAAGFGLSTLDSSMSATQALAGMRFDRQWWAGAVRLGVSGRLEWQRTLSQSGNDIDARFTAIDAWSPILGEALSRDVAVVGLGIDARHPRMGVLRLGVDARRDGARDWMQSQLSWAMGF